MKRIAKFFGLLAITSSLNAQILDTVSLGEGISNQAYYNLLDGAEVNDIKNDWDIAFQTENSFSFSALINEATGTELYEYPGDTTDWVTLDTSGMIASWTRLHNSDTSWNYGAFSQKQSGNFYVGWGTYNQITHNIIGDKLYVVKLSNGVYQKVWIKNLIDRKYNFRHATLTNSMDMAHSVDKANFEGKNFAYFSLQTHSVKDKEPLAENWDLFFGQFTTLIPTPAPTPYLVTGVLHSSQTKSVKVYPVNDPNSFIDWQSQSLSNDINTLGYDWKSYNMSAMLYEIADSTVYFVRNQHGDVFRLIFEDFGGSSTGDVIFNKTQIHFSGMAENKKEINFEMYPNPASDILTIVYESNETTRIEIIDQNGRLVIQETIKANSWNHQFGISELNSGLYTLRIVGESTSSVKKLLVQ